MQKLAIFVVLNFVFVFSVSGGDGDEYCQKPTVDVNFIPTATYPNRVEWYTPFGNKVMLSWITKMLGGKEGTEPCITVKFNSPSVPILLGVIIGFGQLMQWVCTKEKNFYNCHFVDANNKKTDDVIVHMVYFDGLTKPGGHNAMGIAFCFPDGNVGYLVLSIAPALKDDVIKTIGDRFKQVGFDFDNRVRMHTPEKCIHKISSILFRT